MNQYYRNKRTGAYLMHSDAYVGKDFSDSLCHWKYIKRYKVGGKWRYVYADKDTHSNINKDLSDASRYEQERSSLTKSAFDHFAVANRAAKYISSTSAISSKQEGNRDLYWANHYSNKARESSTRAAATINSNSVSNLSAKAISRAKNYLKSLTKTSSSTSVSSMSSKTSSAANAAKQEAQRQKRRTEVQKANAYVAAVLNANNSSSASNSSSSNSSKPSYAVQSHPNGKKDSDNHKTSMGMSYAEAHNGQQKRRRSR